MPSESQEIAVPSGCSELWPTATTGDVSPFRYEVKRAETAARSDEEFCGIRRPWSVISTDPGCCKRCS